MSETCRASLMSAFEGKADSSLSPFYVQKQTSAVTVGMSALCHKQTLRPEGCYLLRPATFPQLGKDFVHVESGRFLSLRVVPECS